MARIQIARGVCFFLLDLSVVWIFNEYYTQEAFQLYYRVKDDLVPHTAPKTIHMTVEIALLQPFTLTVKFRGWMMAWLHYPMIGHSRMVPHYQRFALLVVPFLHTTACKIAFPGFSHPWGWDCSHHDSAHPTVHWCQQRYPSFIIFFKKMWADLCNLLRVLYHLPSCLHTAQQ